MCILLENQLFLTGWGYQKMLSENVILEKAFSDNIRSGFLAPYQKSHHFLTVEEVALLLFTVLYFFVLYPVNHAP